MMCRNRFVPECASHRLKWALVPILAVVVLLFAILGNVPPGNYNWVRIIVTCVAFTGGMFAFGHDRLILTLLFGALTVTFNFFWPLRLERETWLIVDWAGVAVFLYAVPMFAREEIAPVKGKRMIDRLMDSKLGTGLLLFLVLAFGFLVITGVGRR
jgi:hypothetical protein